MPVKFTNPDARQIWEQLRRIADALEVLATAVTAPPEPEPPPDPTCPHPPDQRVDFGLTNGQPDWQCRVCGFRTPTS